MMDEYASQRRTGAEPLVAVARSQCIVGIELGGTKIICTLARRHDDIIETRRLATRDPVTTLAAIETIVDGWVRTHEVQALGIASFGPIQLDRTADDYGHIGQTTKPGWHGTDVVQRLIRRYGVPTQADTDVNAAALAEGRWGAARGLSSWCYITIGTGVGAGIVIGGQTVQGLGHPEAGHMLVRRMPGDDWPGACPFHGDCVEGLVSGPAIERRTGLSGDAITDDDPVWALVADTVAAMVHNMIFTVVPERILLGGGVPSRRPFLIPMIRSRLVSHIGGYGGGDLIATDIGTRLIAPGLGDDAGPLGSLALALDAMQHAIAVDAQLHI
ncbi:ROK family protein [Sphingomonas sp.]|jgi:fructokinase|uniref:ROK family protein n=1 Tax=Sphingomonas sp. TaxID=28214 RepID=UPI0035C803D6